MMHRASVSPLVTVRWLKDVIKFSYPNKKILDASWHLPNTGRNAAAEYREGHIPGASFFDIDECADTSSELPHMIPLSKIFETHVGALGINNETHVIVYDNHPEFPIFSAQRVWWTFRLFGHSKISILEGGLPKWISEGGTITKEIPSSAQETFVAKFNPKLIKYFEDVKKNAENPSFTLVDARPEMRFKGTLAEPRADIKPGCIRNSVNLPFTSVMDLENRTMKSPEELRKLFKHAGVDLSKHVVASCGSGISACLLALAGYLCNKEDIAVYDGSWTEWYKRAPPHLTSNVPK